MVGAGMQQESTGGVPAPQSVADRPPAPVRRRGLLGPVALGAAVVATLAGCGASVADADRRSGPATTTTRAAITPFCSAVMANNDAVNALTDPTQRRDLPSALAAVRRSGAELDALAPPEVGDDVTITNRALELQLAALERNGGDLAALRGDRDLAEQLRDPEIAAAGDRLSAYVSRSCATRD